MGLNDTNYYDLMQIVCGETIWPGFGHYRCRSTAGGRQPCSGFLVSAPEIENVVLQAAGLDQTGLVSNEAEATLRAALQQVLFKADTGRIEILFKPSGDVQV